MTPDRKSDVTHARRVRWLMPRSNVRRNSRQLFTVPAFALLLLLLGVAAAGYLAIIQPSRAQHWYLAQLALLLGMLVMLGVLIRRVQRRLVEPIAQLRDWAARIRGGDLAAKVPALQPAVADLARDLNRLGDDLRSLTHEMNVQARSQIVRLARKTQSLDILYEVATSLNKPLSLDKLLEGFLDTFMDLVDARAASVRLLDTDGKTRIIASRGLSPEIVSGDRTMEVGRCHCGWAAADGAIRIQQGTKGCAKLMGRPYLERECNEFIVVPVQYQGRILGVYNLFLDKPVSSLGEDAHDLLTSIGKHLGLAIENARLDEDARRLAIMEERNMLGNELHDSLAQSLVGMRLQIKMLGETLFKKDLRTAQNEVRQLRLAVEEAHANLRELLSNFRLKITEGGLVPAISNIVERFNQDTTISVFFQNECRELDLSPTQEMHVFRIIQEALTNARKHSQARNARILLNCDERGRYSVLIEDDGTGIAPSQPGMPGEHLGLSIMRERAKSVPGQLTIESDPGEGTRVLLTFDARTPPSYEVSGR